jgi:hypothetical protein
MKPRFEISGRAGYEETAAVAAVIAALMEEEARALATPPRAPRQSSWVLAWRPRDVPAPLPSHTYDSRSWAELESAETGEDSPS